MLRALYSYLKNGIIYPKGVSFFFCARDYFFVTSTVHTTTQNRIFFPTKIIKSIREKVSRNNEEVERYVNGMHGIRKGIIIINYITSNCYLYKNKSYTTAYVKL